MTVVELQWIVGTALSLIAAMTAIAVSSFRAMGNRLDAAVGQLWQSIQQQETYMKNGDDALHARVNRLRQDVSDNYVRRVDLDGRLKRIDDTMKEVSDDQKKLIETVTLLTAEGGVRKRPQRRVTTSS